MGELAARDLLVGRIGGVYGVRGWVRIHSYTAPAEKLLDYPHWSVERAGQWQRVAVDSGRCHGKGLVAHIAGVDDRAAAAVFKNCAIAIPRSALPALAPDEFYWHQLQGLSVCCDGKLLGQVDHLLATGSNDVLVVRPGAGSIDERERLIPWLRDTVVLAVDLAAGRIDVDWDTEF